MEHTIPIMLIFCVSLANGETKYSQDFFSDVLNNLQESVTPKCHIQFQQFITDLGAERLWTKQMVDSNGQIPAGSVTLQFVDLGDFEKCININAYSNNTGDIAGKYCLGSVSSVNLNLTRLQTRDPHLSVLPPLWAFCIPDGCTVNDTNIIGNAILANLLENVSIHVHFNDILCQTVNEVKPELTPAAVVTLVIIAVLVLLVISSTLYDIYCKFYCGVNGPAIIRGVSMYTNSIKIFKMNKINSNHLSCLEGLRWISTMWIIIIHQHSIHRPVANVENFRVQYNKFATIYMLSGSLSVDTFFTIGGILLSSSFLNARHIRKHFNLFWYYIHRYIRLSAPLFMLVLIYATLLNYLGSGPQWPFFIQAFQTQCQKHWWSTLLYVQNYVNPTEVCIGVTWYLDVDMQLYLISPIILFGTWSFPKLGISLLALCCLFPMTFSFYYIWNNSLAYADKLFDQDTVKLYESTHARFTPWIIGIITGHYIFKIKQLNKTKLMLNKSLVNVLWFLCIGSLLTCAYSSYYIDKNWTVLGIALHTAVLRPVWSLAIAWIALACVSNNGGPINWVLSLPIYQVLNKFSYSIYLVHTFFICYLKYSCKWPVYWSEFSTDYEFWGTLAFSSGVAALLVFIVECPAAAIEKFLYEITPK